MNIKDLLLSADPENINLASILHYEGNKYNLIKEVIEQYYSTYNKKNDLLAEQRGLCRTLWNQLYHKKQDAKKGWNDYPYKLEQEYNIEDEKFNQIENDLSYLGGGLKLIFELFAQYVPVGWGFHLPIYYDYPIGPFPVPVLELSDIVTKKVTV